MNTHPRDEPSDLPMAWLKKHLKSLSQVIPPETLRQRLMADAARAGAVTPSEPRGHGWSTALRYVGVAAAVILLTGVVVRLGIPSGRTRGPVADQNEDVSLALAADYNSLRPLDTNVCDNNGLH